MGQRTTAEIELGAYWDGVKRLRLMSVFDPDTGTRGSLPEYEAIDDLEVLAINTESEALRRSINRLLASFRSEVAVL